MSKVILSGTKVLVGDSDTKSQLVPRGFGEEVDSQYSLSLIEALFLVEQGNIEVVEGDAVLGVDDLIGRGSTTEPEFYNKFLVYRDLRGRGLLVRSGFKFGTDFRIYERGASLGKSHSTKLVHVVPEEYSTSVPELSRSIRLAGNVKKKMIYAVVDGESDITYYQIERIKP